MRNKRFFVVLAGALVFGLLAAVTVSRYLSSAQAFSKDMNRVVVAKVAIPLGTKIIAEHVMVVQFSKESTPDGVFESVEKLVGRVAVVNIGAREPVTETRLAPEGTTGGLSAVIPEGYRAMTVKVDDVVGISGFIMPGTLVDVVVVIQAPRIRFPKSSCRASRFWQTARTLTSPKANASQTASRLSLFS